MKEKVELSIRCHDLKNVAGAFKGTSDPYAVVTLLASDTKSKPTVLGKTEVIKNNLSPSFVKRFVLDYEFGQLTHFTITIFDAIRKSKEDKLMGSAMFEVGSIMGKRGNMMAKRLRKSGSIFARISKVEAEDSGDIELRLAGYKLKNVEGLFSKSDPFFEIHSETGSNEFGNLVYRSEHVKNNLNPLWKPASINLNSLCGGDRTKAFRFTVYDHEKNGKHKLMGAATTTVNELVAAKTGSATDTSTALTLTTRNVKKGIGSLVVVDARIKNVPSTGDAGEDLQKAVAVVSLYEEDVVAATPTTPLPVPYPTRNRPTFVDYLTGGCEILTHVAIDFTGSNGDPRKPGTLHYFSHNGELNQYEKAIKAVVGILCNYDSDQMFPVYGFGAKIGGTVRHIFQVGSESEVSGTQGVLDAYKGVFSSGLIMSGPTVFDEVIQHSAKKARFKQEEARQIGKQAYTVLVLLTDGAVTDVNACSKALIEASSAPLSVVIIGVGNADFSSMQFLDNLQVGRDICQFVEFRNHEQDKRTLTAATLNEIPEQLVGYFQSNGIDPAPKIERGGSIILDNSKAFIEDVSYEEEIAVSLDVDDNGEVMVVSGGIYDQTHYSMNAPFATSSSANVHTPTSTTYITPTAPTQQYHTQNFYVPPPGHVGNVPNQFASAPPPYQGGGYNVTKPAAPVAVAQAYPVQPQNTFPVQVPPGVVPGQQVQIQNPFNGQIMIVTVPHGVPSGGTFNVQY